MEEDQQVAITMPLYNEAETVSDYLRSIDSAFKLIGVSPMFIVADDCSTDNSLEVLQDLSKELNMTLIVGAKNQGSGPTQMSALIEASKQNLGFVVNCDSDGQFSPNDIVSVFQRLCAQSPSDALVQTHRTGRKEEWYRRIGTFGGNCLASIKARRYVQDSNCPLRGFSTEVLSKMLYQIKSNQITPNMALSVLSAKMYSNVPRIKVSWQPRSGDTKQGTLWTSQSSWGAMRKYSKFCYRASIQWFTWHPRST